jgi:predicted Holliday junction resolvase-like endonuclease
MKPPQFIVTVVLSLVVLVLVINLIFMGQKNQALQAELQAQQEDINKGSMSQQIGTNLLKEIAQASVTDEKLKEVLSKSGYTVNIKPIATPAPSPGAPRAASPAATP